MSREAKKVIFRKEVLSRVNSYQSNRYKKDKILNRELIEYIKQNNYKKVMIFIPLKNEVNLNPTIKELRRKGIVLYVPFMEGKSFKLVKYRLPLHTKKFGIKEPNISNIKIKSIELSIIPILGIDINCRRVGYGKGMYDRFFEKSKNLIKSRAFIQRDLFVCNQAITDRYDIGSDTIFTTSINIINI